VIDVLKVMVLDFGIAGEKWTFGHLDAISR
jgi:hypothetical protein